MKHNKLFAFFGYDLANNDLTILQNAAKSGYTLFALDAKAISFAIEANLPYMLIDNWIDAKTMRHIANEALRTERRWFEPAKELFTRAGICWPLFDHAAMFWFWRDVTLASFFIQRFIDGGGDEIKFLKPCSFKPTVYYDKSESWKTIFDSYFHSPDKHLYNGNNTSGLLQYLNANKIQSVINTKCRFSQEERSTINLSLSRSNHSIKSIPLKERSGKIVFALNQGESHRFTHVIKQLSEQYSGKVEAIILFYDPHMAKVLSEAWSIPVYCCPSEHKVDVSLRDRFVEGYRVSLNNASGKPWYFPMKHMQYHFEYYCRHRWPMLAASLSTWMEIWKLVKPNVVLTSQLIDAESQLPAEAANRLGIETFAMPHGGFYLGDEAQVSKNNLYSFKTHKYHLKKGGIPEENIVACKGIVADNEYQMKGINLEMLTSEKPTWKILVLSTMATLDGVFLPIVSLQGQINAFKILNNPPQNIADKLFIKFKVHPGWPDLESLSVAGINIERDVFPPNSDLHSILHHFDLIIDLNLSGTAIIHTIRAIKPILFFWPCRVNFSHWYEEIFLQAGKLADNPEKLWKHITRFFTEDKFAQLLRNKVEIFANNYLDDGNFPTLGDLIQDKVFLKKAYNRPLEKSAGYFKPDANESLCGINNLDMRIVNIDANPEFFYGEISKEHMIWILERNKQGNSIEAVTHEYCNHTKNEYFREYALDRRRSLCLYLLGNLKGKNILDYGCGLGSIGVVAAQFGAYVSFTDNCLVRLEYALARCKELELTNTSFYGCHSWKSLPFNPETYEIILLNGIMEWIPQTLGVNFENVFESQLEFLQGMARFLKKEGCIFLAIENRFALQYFMGYPEDHTNIPYLSILSRREANELHLKTKGTEFVTWTWSLNDYIQHLPKIGLYVADSYAMFPDYRFPRMLACLNDTNALKKGMMMEKYDSPISEMNREKHINYFAEMGLLRHFVYSYGLIIKKCP
ncbi:MAG: class I SAM-dependent methyltransferase [Planctomycetes bacterium]|nr:class I SAM-dependent methyltransferase [Planctomycetota bacterium]